MEIWFSLLFKYRGNINLPDENAALSPLPSPRGAGNTLCSSHGDTGTGRAGNTGTCRRSRATACLKSFSAQVRATARARSALYKLELYNNYTICWIAEIYKVISSQFIVLSGGGPHQIIWRAIFIHSSHRECLNFNIKRPTTTANW